MTRINCLPPEYLMDKHLQAHLREGLRPLNNILAGKDSLKDCPPHWTLGKGHEIFHRKHLEFTVAQWYKAKEEHYSRGGKGFDYEPDLSRIHLKYLNSYTPTVKDMRSNLARIIVMWRKRKSPYYYKGFKVESRADIKEYIDIVKKGCVL